MPLHHTNGINNQILAPLLAGAETVLIDRFDAMRVSDQIDRYEPTIVTGVPTMYLRMLDHLDRSRPRPSLRMLRCGSAPLTHSQQREIEAGFGVPLVVSYGLSEATCTTAMNPPDQPRAGTVGTILAGQQVRIVMPGTTREAPAGDEGEICIGGPTVMSGYVGSHEPNPVHDGWLYTGDLGRLDSEGYLMVTGRIKDVIIRGGENLAPNAIESALATHPLVTDAGVVGAAHDDLGEVPVAFVVPTDPARPPALEELRDHVTRALSRVYAPHRVLVVPALPTNALGKIDKNGLRAELSGE
jgi:acyl-CoA synthetase (AMP-forming)/AMP-acid ligase II